MKENKVTRLKPVDGDAVFGGFAKSGDRIYSSKHAARLIMSIGKNKRVKK